MRFDRIRRTCYVGLAGALMAALSAGCSSPSNTASNAKPEKTSLVVGALPAPNAGAIIIAQKHGLFKAEGLDVKLKIYPGGASSFPDLAKGALDITLADNISLFQAHEAGTPIKILAESEAAQPSRVGIAPIVVAPNSPIRKVSDLKGKRIAVNARRNIAELAVVSALEVNNVNVKRDKVKIVPVPFPAMAQTLQKGKVDAAWAVEPFSIIVEQQGARRITETLTGPMAGFPTSSYAISPDYAQKYPNTAAAFKRAISKAVAMADKDSPVEADAVATITKLPKPLVSNMLPVAYVTSTNPVRLQRAADLMFKFRYLKRQVKAQEMIA